MYYRRFGLLVTILLVSLYCKSEISIQNDTTKTDGDFYLYPTPSEIFEVIDVGKVSFNKDLLNPIDNEQKYILSKDKYLNIGIYMADLTYCTFFSKKAKSKLYYEAISNMCGCLLISSNLKGCLSKEIAENAEDIDSVFKTVNTYYYDIMTELDENKSNNVIYTITTGAYVESFYIMLNLVNVFDEENVLLQKIAEEKYALHNLHKFSKRYESDSNLTDIIRYQEEILKIFDLFLVSKGTKRSFTIADDGKIKFTGGSKITMNKEQFEDLKVTVENIRNEIIN